MLDNGKPGCRFRIVTYHAYLNALKLIYRSNRDYYPHWSWQDDMYSSIVMAELYDFIQDIAGIYDTDGVNVEWFASRARIILRYIYHEKTWKLEGKCLQGYDGGHHIDSARYVVSNDSYTERRKTYSKVCDYSVPAHGYTYESWRDNNQ